MAAPPPPPPPPPLHQQVTVFVRVRPLSEQECLLGARSLVECEGNCVSIVKAQRNDGVLSSERGAIHEFQFDRAFGPEATQEQVFEATTAGVIRELCSSVSASSASQRNACVFAYGATGSGKSHSMLGNRDGILPQSLTLLFSLLRDRAALPLAQVRVSYLEIYNEQIFDLLSGAPDKALIPCEQPDDGSVRILGLGQVPVHNVDDALRLVDEGNLRRKTEATAANAVSSRSHAVFQVHVVCDEAEVAMALKATRPALASMDANSAGNSRRRHTFGGKTARPALSRESLGGLAANLLESDNAVWNMRLTLVDLAGSERAAATQNRGARLREGASINRSLLALANAINALSTPGVRAKFRDSKLTHMLKSSLIGNCRVIMLATINPSHKAFDESLNTLKYADRAKHIPVSHVRPAAAPPGPLPSPPKHLRVANLEQFARSQATQADIGNSNNENDRVNEEVAHLRAEVARLKAELEKARSLQPHQPSPVLVVSEKPVEREVFTARSSRLRQPSQQRFVPIVSVDLTQAMVKS